MYKFRECASDSHKDAYSCFLDQWLTRAELGTLPRLRFSMPTILCSVVTALAKLTRDCYCRLFETKFKIRSKAKLCFSVRRLLPSVKMGAYFRYTIYEIT